MTARGTGPPGNGAGAHGEAGAGGDERQRSAGSRSVVMVDDRPDDPPEARPPTADIEAYLTALVARCDDVPLIAELDAADIGTARGTASIARAALAWLTDGTPMATRRRLLDELDESDRLVIARLGSTHDDIRGDTDWTRVLDVVTARREYRERWGVA